MLIVILSEYQFLVSINKDSTVLGKNSIYEQNVHKILKQRTNLSLYMFMYIHLKCAIAQCYMCNDGAITYMYMHC